MAQNPYTDPEGLANLLWETEAVADKYFNGNLILIRTKDGWKAHLGTFSDDVLPNLEIKWDKPLSRYYLSWLEGGALDKIPRHPKLDDEFKELLPDCMCFPEYRPMKLTEDDLVPSEGEDIPF